MRFRNTRRRYRIYTGRKEVVFDPYTKKFTIIFDSIIVQVDLDELIKAAEEHDYILDLRKG